MLNIKEIAINFLTGIAVGNIIETFEKYGTVEFKHHNVHYKGDLISLRNGMFMSQENLPNKSLEIKHVIAEGDMVVIHSNLRLSAEDVVGIILVHIFKIKNSKIIEMWDMNQVIPDDSPNQYGAF